MRRSVSLLALTLLLAQPCFAIDLPKNLAQTQEDTRFAADTVRYDQKNQQIIAEGNVVVSREGRTLKADKIVYTQPTNSVTATGNITLTDTNNNTLYADSAEITDDLKSGIIEKIRVRFADESRLLATRATRTNANTNTLEGGAFTPCRVCKDDIPLWEIHAKQVVHDEVEKTITYHGASLEVGGVPVFYFPYFQHPDPTVKQATGFLPPTLQFSDDKGVLLKTPYYFALSPSKDLEFSPILMTRGGASKKGTLKRVRLSETSVFQRGVSQGCRRRVFRACRGGIPGGVFQRVFQRVYQTSGRPSGTILRNHFSEGFVFRKTNRPRDRH